MYNTFEIFAFLKMKYDLIKSYYHEFEKKWFCKIDVETIMFTRNFIFRKQGKIVTARQ